VISLIAVAAWVGTRSASEPLPDVTSLTAQDAEARLTAAGFTRIELVREESRIEGSRRSTAYLSCSGAKINQANTVKVYVSTGFHRTVQVPINQPFTDSGIDVSTGETITVQAYGKIRHAPAADSTVKLGRKEIKIPLCGSVTYR
jgi:hypothetical protein